MISEYWRDQNSLLHESCIGFGIRGARHSDIVQQLCRHIGTVDVLDYGCGAAKLSASLPFPISSYDPCIPKFSRHPSPADVVVCTDVMEHVEGDMINQTLREIFDLSRIACYFAIATKPDWSKSMPDGSNPHCSVMSHGGWLEILTMLFGHDCIVGIKSSRESFFICRKQRTIDLLSVDWRIPS